MMKAVKWLKSLLFIQFNLNNSKNVISKTFNKTVYKFSLHIIFIFISFTLNINTECILSILSA